MTWNPTGELQPFVPREKWVHNFLLFSFYPTDHPADVGNLLFLGITELNWTTAFCRSGKVRVDVLQSGSLYSNCPYDS